MKTKNKSLWDNKPVKLLHLKKEKQLKANQQLGKASQNGFLSQAIMMEGKKVVRNHFGYDFDTFKEVNVLLRDNLNLKIEHRKVEVKSRKAELTPFQKEMQKKHPKIFEVRRI